MKLKVKKKKEWINYKVLLYSTGNYIQYSVVDHTEKKKIQPTTNHNRFEAVKSDFSVMKCYSNSIIILVTSFILCMLNKELKKSLNALRDLLGGLVVKNPPAHQRGA